MDDETYECVDINGSIASAIDRDRDEAKVIDLDTMTKVSYSRVTPSTSVCLHVLLMWACALFLVTFVLVVAVRTAFRLIAHNRVGELVAPFAALAVVLTIAIAVGNSAYFSYKTQIETRKNEVNAYADFVCEVLPDHAKALCKNNNRSLFVGNMSMAIDILDSLNSAFTLLTGLSDSANANDINLYFCMYGEDEQGTYCLLSSHGEYVLGETVSGASSSDAVARAFDGELSYEMQTGTSRYESTVYRVIRIEDPTEQGNDIVVEIGSRMSSFEGAALRNIFRNGLALLVMLLVVYMCYAELRACGRCVVRYRRMQAAGEEGAISAIARPFALISMMLAGVDGVMSTLIAKDLLSAAGMDVAVSDEAKLLIMVPAVMLGIGQALGQGIYGTLGSKAGLRKLMVRWSGVMIVCSALTCAAVVSGSFQAYCAAKLLLSIPFGLLYMAAYSLRRHAVTKEQRELAKAGVKRSNTSSAALGTALGGYAAALFGNAGVYVALALVSVAMLAMTVALIPAHAMPPEEMREFSREEHARIRRFLLSPRTLVIVLAIIFPSVIATGYASSLFPLFSSQMGFEKTDINNVYLIGQLIVYVSIAGIEVFSKRVGSWNAALFGIAGLGLVFLAFSLNTTVVWGMVAIAFVGLLVKIANAWKPLWIAEAGAHDVPLGWATGAMYATRSLLRIAKPFVLGGLLLVSGQVAVIIIGAFCLACATAIFDARRTNATQ